MGYDKRRHVAQIERDVVIEHGHGALERRRQRVKRKPQHVSWHAYCTNVPKKKWKRRHRRYMEYLRSPEWRQVRDAARERADHKCERCSGTTRLHVHHVTYVRLGAEKPEDLRVLCQKCHSGVHRNTIEEPPPNKKTKQLIRAAFEQRLANAHTPKLKQTRRRPKRDDV